MKTLAAVALLTLALFAQNHAKPVTENNLGFAAQHAMPVPMCPPGEGNGCLALKK